MISEQSCWSRRENAAWRAESVPSVAPTAHLFMAPREGTRSTGNRSSMSIPRLPRGALVLPGFPSIARKTSRNALQAHLTLYFSLLLLPSTEPARSVRHSSSPLLNLPWFSVCTSNVHWHNLRDVLITTRACFNKHTAFLYVTRQCFCGAGNADYDRHGALDPSFCGTSCVGNLDQKCGGTDAIEVRLPPASCLSWAWDERRKTCCPRELPHIECVSPPKPTEVA